MAVTLKAPRWGSNLKEIWIQFKHASRLGWLIESNWADPFVFAVYSLMRPLSTALILVFMYLVVVRGSTSNPFFAQLYIGNAFFMYAGRVMMGISYAIIDDREHYEMLKYIYISPLRIFVFLLGRGVAQVITTTISVLIILLLGLWPLGIRIPWGSVNWSLFLVSFPLGIIAISFMGYLLAGLVLVLARHAWPIAEGVGAVLYVVSGAIFPIDVLPIWVQGISKAIPLTYWLELLRRSLLGSSFSPAFNSMPTWELFLWLLGLTVLFGFLGYVVFQRMNRVARQRGMIDQITGY
jgi:ABC-2 type transport system permease protein